MAQIDDQPYCKVCGYSLRGLTESSKCPECGGAIVDVLVRDTFPGAQSRRYTSTRKLLGLPLLAIAHGPLGGEKYGKPVGVVAVGDRPRGIIAVGGLPLGVFACGGVARGVFCFGGVSIGIVSIGGISMGLLAAGGLVIAGWGIGGRVFAAVSGWGGYVTGIWPF